jgi:hypothetical protein
MYMYMCSYMYQDCFMLPLCISGILLSVYANKNVQILTSSYSSTSLLDKFTCFKPVIGVIIHSRPFVKICICTCAVTCIKIVSCCHCVFQGFSHSWSPRKCTPQKSPPKKRSRNRNWSQQELRSLVEYVALHKDAQNSENEWPNYRILLFLLP